MHPYFRFNDEERDTFDHDGLIGFSNDEELTSRQQSAATAAHDRIYGNRLKCPYCMETSLRRLQHRYERAA